MAVHRSPRDASRAGLKIIFRVDDLRSFLEGEWHLDRSIVDDRLERNGTLQGAASFTRSDEGLVYRETGRLTFGDYADDVSRDYRYEFSAPGIARVRFADGRPFHDLDLRDGETAVRHVCGADAYDGVIRADTECDWSAVWTVNGPRKSLRITSRYYRVP